MKTKIKEILLPERVAKIQDVGEQMSFQGRDDIVFGIEIIMDNGDVFSYWNADKYKLELFKPGTSMVYQIKKIIENIGTDNEKVKVRLDKFDFVLPRAVRAEHDLPKKIMDSISYSVTEANKVIMNNTDAWVPNEGAHAYGKLLSSLAQEIHNCTKAMLLAEDFGDA